ncbi:MAG TPA: biotin/lipoyl-containing protein [Acidobacteriota bacterium]|nr:biotin/lipoyl-containing protein [Acidobacteriota bacterium]
MKLVARLANGDAHIVEFSGGRGETEILLDGQPVSLEFQKLSGSHCLISRNGRIVDAVVHRQANQYTVILSGKTYLMELLDQRLQLAAESDTPKGVQSIKAQMPGRVVKLLKSIGDALEKNTAVLLIEAMKMQNEIRSPCRGVLAQIAVKEGQPVNTGQLLFEVK